MTFRISCVSVGRLHWAIEGSETRPYTAVRNERSRRQARWPWRLLEKRNWKIKGGGEVAASANTVSTMAPFGKVATRNVLLHPSLHFSPKAWKCWLKHCSFLSATNAVVVFSRPRDKLRSLSLSHPFFSRTFYVVPCRWFVPPAWTVYRNPTELLYRLSRTPIVG